MPGSGTFRVAVSKDYLTFSAAHFITIPGHKCESLHGHNYVVTVAVEGSVDSESGFVVDFAILKRILRPVIDALDHRVLLPTRNQHVVLRVVGDQIQVDYRGATRFMFPSSNVARVPVTDTSAELLAEHLAATVLIGLGVEGVHRITRVVVDVEESPGQSGTFKTIIP